MNRFGQYCYTYLLGWRDLDIWYYGYRGANKITPQDDLPIYLSSSEHVDAFIDANGPPDVVRVHRLFEDKFAAKKHETKFIKKVDAVRSPRWLNKHDGGENWGVARFFTDEHKKKISEAKMGHSVSDESRAKMSAKRASYMQTDEGRLHLEKMIANRGEVWNKGAPLSEETKTKISETVRAKYDSGYVSPSKGKPKPEETRARIGAAKKGKTQTEEHRKRNSDALKAAWVKRKAAKLG